MISTSPIIWPSARHLAEAIQTPALCFTDPVLQATEPAFDRLGMPLVTSGQFAFVFKLKASNRNFAVRCFRGFAGDREERYQAIHEHLKRHAVPALGSFEYQPAGLLVGGRTFPILVMEWVEGHTLDVYLDEVLGRTGLHGQPDQRRNVMLHLADEWLRLIRSLRRAGVAHGDLQHGNIIVNQGRLRLVDLDGMFVPSLEGWQACELGHQHYQHPQRTADLFNFDLDNFSTLVIYVSLIALAEQPQLWTEHHDENLLLTKADYLDPASAVLLRKMKDLGGEPRRYAEMLETAAMGDPKAVPCIITSLNAADEPSEFSELYKGKSKLPAWMVEGLDLEVTTRTRERLWIDVPAEVKVEDALEIAPSILSSSARSMPTTPASASVQTLFSSVQPAQNLAAATPFAFPLDQSQLFPATLYYAKSAARVIVPFSGLLFISIRPLLQWMLGVSFPTSLLLIVLMLIAGFLVYGLLRALNNLAPAAAAAAPHALPLTIYGYIPQSISASVAGAPLVGSNTGSIYHLATCDWSKRIMPHNQIWFASATDAEATGYRRCKICLP